MAGIDELIAQLALGAAQKQAIAESDPYAPGIGITDQIGNLAVTAGPQYKTRDKIILGALSGLAGGLFSGASQDYQSRAADAYSDAVFGFGRGLDVEKPSVLSPTLFSSAKQQGNLFQLRRALQAGEMADALAKESKLAEIKGAQDIKTELAKELIKNPRRGAQAASAIANLFGKPAQPTAAPAPIQGMDTDQSGLDLALGGVPSVKAPTEAEIVKKAEDVQLGSQTEDPIAMYNRIYDETGDEVLARSAYEKAQEATLKAKELTSKTITEQSLAQENSKRILAELDAAIEGAGTTGNLWPMEDKIRGLNVGVQADAGVEGADTRQGARRVLNSLGIDFAGQIRKSFPGSVSEREFLKYLEAAPGTDKTVAENKALAERMRRMSQAAEASNAFVAEQVAQGKSIDQALLAYGELEKSAPLFVPDKTGAPTINPIRLATPKNIAKSDIASQSATVETPATDSALQNTGKIVGKFVQGVAKTPSAIASIFSPSTYKEAFKDTETGLRTVGTGAAMTAGGSLGTTAGAALGAFGGPFAPITVPLGGLLGGAIGTGLGYLGYGTAEEAGSELAGVGSDRPVVPGMPQIEQAAEVAGTGFGVGAAAKAASTVGKAVGSVASGAAGLSDEAVQSAKQNALGVTRANLQKSAESGAAKYFDDAGNEVKIKDATTYASKIEQAIKLVDDDGLFANIKNDPKANRVQFDSGAKAAAQEISNLHNAADQALADIHAGLPKIQQRQFPLTRDPLTNKGGFLPNKADFAAVFDRIREIGKSDPQMVPALTKRANAVIESWNKTSRSYNALQDRKSLIGKSAKWGKGSTATTDAWNLVKQDFNRIFAETQKNAFDFAMQQKNPALVGKLADANAKFSAYKTLEPIVHKGTATKAPLRVGIIDTPRSIFKRSPGTTLSAAENVSGITNAISGGINAVGKGVGAVRNVMPNAQVLPGALSPQDDLDVALSQARQSIPAQSAAPQPEIQEAPAMPIQKPKAVPEDLFNQIASDPVDLATMMIESAGNPKAKNQQSSASGLFQLINETAKNLGVKDVFDPYENYQGYLKLKAEAEPYVQEPSDYYAFHFLGQPTYLKWKQGDQLSEKQAAQVAQLENDILPKWTATYNQAVGVA